MIGKIQPPTRDGDMYFYSFINKMTGYIQAYTFKIWEAWTQSKMLQILFRTKNEMETCETAPWRAKYSSIILTSLCTLSKSDLIEIYLRAAVSTIIHGQSHLKPKLWKGCLQNISCLPHCLMRCNQLWVFFVNIGGILAFKFAGFQNE